MKIAIFGAGQLAMMMVQADQEKKHKFTVIDPSPNPPASHYAEHIQSQYDDRNTLDKIAKECDLATIDFENVSVNAMRQLEKSIPVHPSSHALEICQDRLKEKTLFNKLNIKTTNFFPINNISDLNTYRRSNQSYILKSRRFGYDGKNQYRITPDTKIQTDLINEECILEELVDFEAEVSLISVKSVNGNIYFYPLVENTHKDGILSMSVCPSGYDFLQSDAERIGSELLEAMNYVGVMVVEFFISKDKILIANEIAPRVHNSGHWTIEGSNISQFYAHINAITGYEKNDSITYMPSVMFNVLSKHIPIMKIDSIKKKYEISVHDYHKSERENRKLGHITHTCKQSDQLIKNIRAILEIF